MQRFLTLLLFVIVSITWGTTWMAMKLAVETIPPLCATGMRFLFAAPLLIGLAYFTKAPLRFPPGRRRFQLAVTLFYYTIPFALMIYGEQWVSSGLASVIFANMPVAVLVVSMLLLKEKTNGIQLLGLVVAVCSLAAILLHESASSTSGATRGILALVAALVIHAVMYTQCKKQCSKLPILTFNALPTCTAGMILLLTSWVVEKPVLSNFSITSILATLYLGAYAGVFGILCYFLLQKRTTAFQASMLFLVFPLIALELENLTYGHALSPYAMRFIPSLICGILLTLAAKAIWPKVAIASKRCSAIMRR